MCIRDRRKGEPEQVVRVFKEEMGANLIYVDAVDCFLDKLAGVSDPEQKRKICLLYTSDMEAVRAAIAAKKASGEYPVQLWK